MDKFGDKARRDRTDHSVSPYLMRPLRSLAGVLANRIAKESGTTDGRGDSCRPETRPLPLCPKPASPVMDQ